MVKRKTIRAVTMLVCMSIVSASCGFFADFEKQVAADIKDNPVIRTHLGTIDSIDIDWSKTGDETGENVFVFEISGPKGAGTLTAECITVDAEREDVVSGTLRLASGKEFNLFPMAGDY
ncbi:MAG: hypothetical protein E2P02_10745 [Acidobacteria bacterium]|nr:MAG: hypothetical protein E2P02_10745 [Acidobacteriota bacterium]